MNNPIVKDDDYQKLMKTLKELLDIKHKSPDYNSLSDKKIPYFTDDSDYVRMLVISDHSLADYLLLLEKTQYIVKEYMLMKDFIVDNFVPFMSENITVDADICKQMQDDIKGEMNDILKHMTAMASILSDKKQTALHKNIVFNELQNLVHDIEYRIQHYRPYYQSYILDNTVQ